MTTRHQYDASVLIEAAVDKLRIDSAYLRMNSRDAADDQAARVLETAALKIRRLSDSLERLARSMVGVS